MSKDKNYIRLMNSPRWRPLRNAYLTEHPLCEMCKAKGRIIAANCVHHIKPVEEAKSVDGIDGMEERCYDWGNLMALCHPCHTAIHASARSHSKEVVLQRRADAFERWKQAHQPQHNAAAKQTRGVL